MDFNFALSYIGNILPYHLQELFYHNGSGFIEYRLKTIRQKLQPEEMRRRRTSTQSSKGTAHGTATHSKANTEEDDNSDEEPDPSQQEMVGFISKISLQLHIYL